MTENLEHAPSDPGHAALFENLGDNSQYVPLSGKVDEDGYPILDDVYVGQTVEAIQYGRARPEWGTFRPAVRCRALIDTGTMGCTIIPALVGPLDLKTVPGTDRVWITQLMSDGSSGGRKLAYPVAFTIGAAFFKQVNAPDILVPARDAEGKGRYEILIGGEILKDCVLIYDGSFEKEFTLYVPRNI
jgi:hypothetical protein